MRWLDKMDLPILSGNDMLLDEAHKHMYKYFFKHFPKGIIPSVKCNFFAKTVIYPIWCRTVGDGREGTRLHRRYSEHSQSTAV